MTWFIKLYDAYCALVVSHPLWFSFDKWAHGWLHFGLVVGLRWRCHLKSWQALCISVVAGIIYELVFDGWLWRVLFHTHENPDVKDVIWNILGAVMGILL